MAAVPPPIPAGARPYRMKPHTVHAIRWDGTERSAEEAAAAFPQLLRVTVIKDPHPLSRRPPIILLDLPGLGGKTVQERTACWIVRGPAGGVFFAKDKDFADIYEPADEGAEA